MQVFVFVFVFVFDLCLYLYLNWNLYLVSKYKFVFVLEFKFVIIRLSLQDQTGHVACLSTTATDSCTQSTLRAVCTSPCIENSLLDWTVDTSSKQDPCQVWEKYFSSWFGFSWWGENVCMQFTMVVITVICHNPCQARPNSSSSLANKSVARNLHIQTPVTTQAVVQCTCLLCPYPGCTCLSEASSNWKMSILSWTIPFPYR